MKKRQSKRVSKVEPAVLGRKAFIAITAVEGLALSDAGQRRISNASDTQRRRAEVLKAYSGTKGRT
jgi:hypothetical protein